MLVLVDYDNIPALERQRGVTYNVERIIRAIGVDVCARSRRARVRLYGGWFEGQRISRSAQTISARLQSDFPRQVAVTGPTESVSVTTNAELAAALECDSSKTLTHTYRTKAPPENLRAAPIPFVGCHVPGGCPLAPMASFLAAGTCSQPGCGVTVETALFREQQKLVDTMLVADMIHFARLSASSQEPLVIVSTDDDIWPGIHTAVIYGAAVLHVHPVPGRATPPHYSALVGGTYRQLSL
jgi:hypothetical protein